MIEKQVMMVNREYKLLIINVLHQTFSNMKYLLQRKNILC
jgi:hypothetical protein